MTTLSQQENDFILELYTRTEGDSEAQVSMYDVGERFGLAKNEATALSQDLMVEELIELRTLSGGISITGKGIALLQKAGLITATSSAVRLGDGPVLDDSDRQETEAILNEIRAVSCCTTTFNQMAELVIAVKTLETQLLSPKPKSNIVRPILLDLSQLLRAADATQLSQRIETFIGR